VEEHRPDPDRVTGPVGCLPERPGRGEQAEELRLQVRVAEPGVPVARQPAEVRGPYRVRLACHPELPADHPARRRRDPGLVPEVLIGPPGRSAVGDDAPTVEQLEQEVGNVPGRLLPLPAWPGQLERLSCDPGHPGVAVGLEEVMSLQPRLVGNVRPGCHRPPPARKIPLPAVGRQLPEGPRLAEVNSRRVLKVDDMPPVPIIGERKLDPLRQVHVRHGRMHARSCDIKPIHHHASIMPREGRKLARHAASSKRPVASRHASGA
jgi:hypothetical protein